MNASFARDRPFEYRNRGGLGADTQARRPEARDEPFVGSVAPHQFEGRRTAVTQFGCHGNGGKRRRKPKCVGDGSK